MSRAAYQVLRPIPKILENPSLLSLLEDYALAIPDWANDQHTPAGKMLGRGLDHFRKEGAKLVLEPAAVTLRARSLQALVDQAAGQVNPPAEGSARSSFAPCSFTAEPFGVCRHLSSILLNNFVSRGTSHQACTGLPYRKHFFTNHALGFALGRFAATHQLRDPQRDHPIAF
jgi:hypothetical protein